MNEIQQKLIEAKALITPETWAKGDIDDESQNICAAIAIERIYFTCAESVPAKELFRKANGIENFHGSIAIWNDAPERTLEEVYEAFDKAIAAAA